MPSSFFFSLEPEGLGSAEVECLASYLHRLAAAHGVTLYQLIDRLRHWWPGRAGKVRRSLPKHCHSVRFNGYGPDVEVLVAALCLATDLPTIRACTLLSMKEIGAGNRLGSVKQTRAWCPACYREAAKSGRTIYDRLLWQVQGVEKCQLHGIALIQACKSCGGLQRNQASRTSLALCESCGADLAGDPADWRGMEKAEINEALLNSLFEFTSSNPNYIFRPGAMTVFCDLMVERYSRRVLIRSLGELFHKRWYDLRMTITSMLEVSTYFDVPLEFILLDPRGAAAQMSLGFEAIHRSPVIRGKYRDSSRLERAQSILRNAIAEGPPYPTVTSIARMADMTTGYLRFNLQGSVKELTQLRSKQLAKTKAIKIRRIRQLLATSERRGGLSKQRNTIRRVAKKSGSSVSLVRKLVQAEKIGHVATQNHVAASLNYSTLSAREELCLSHIRQEVDWMSPVGVRQLLFPDVWGRSSRSKLENLRYSGRILFIKNKRKYIYPRTQFDARRRCVRKRVVEILERLPESIDGRREVLWFYSPNPNLGGMSPIDCLEQDISAVMSLSAHP